MESMWGISEGKVCYKVYPFLFTQLLPSSPQLLQSLAIYTPFYIGSNEWISSVGKGRGEVAAIFPACFEPESLLNPVSSECDKEGGC